METGSRILSFFRTAARGLEAQRKALSTATENIANAQTTRTANGQPYAVKRALHRVEGEQYQQFGQMLASMQTELKTTEGSHMTRERGKMTLSTMDMGPRTEIVSEAKTRREFDPSHPDADAAGYVHYPDINVVEEMARMISANRLYEANLSSVNSAKEMIKRTLEI